MHQYIPNPPCLVYHIWQSAPYLVIANYMMWKIIRSRWWEPGTSWQVNGTKHKHTLNRRKAIANNFTFYRNFSLFLLSNGHKINSWQRLTPSMADATSSATVKVLSLELKALQKEPVEGFQVSLPDDSNFFEWNIVIFGPPKTLYEGGYFKVELSCTCCKNFVRFLSGFWMV